MCLFGFSTTNDVEWDVVWLCSIQLEAEYPQDLRHHAKLNQHQTRSINKLFWDFANRKQENLEYLFMYFGSGMICVCPSKKALLILDDGGCGKTTVAEFVKQAAAPRYNFSIMSHICWLLEHFCK